MKKLLIACGVAVLNVMWASPTHASALPGHYRIGNKEVYVLQRKENAHQTIFAIAVSNPKNIKIILRLESKPHLYTSQIYYSGAQLSYTDENNHLTVKSDGARMRYPYIQSTSNQNWVLSNGDVNYNLTQKIYGPSGLGVSDIPGSHVPYGKRLDAIFTIHGSEGVPLWQTEYLVSDPYPTDGYPRFWSAVRLKDAPPFKVSSSLLAKFPYLGIGTEVPNEFTENSTEFYYDTTTNQLDLSPIVGFEQGGTYQINSLSIPPKVDFESPAIFYDFVPQFRYAEETLRAQSFPKGDQFGPSPLSEFRSSYRVSWKTSSLQRWHYSLDVAGFQHIKTPIKIGKYSVNTLPPSNNALKWVMDQRWAAVTFVDATKGYPGSEGIYQYTTQTNRIWNWLGGVSNTSPTYLAHPKLPLKDSDTSGISLPQGFEGDYSSSYFHRPKLYLNTLTRQPDLLYANGGVWNLKSGILYSYNETGGPYLDQWTYKAKDGKGDNSLYALGSYFLWESPSGVRIYKDSKFKPATVLVSIPTGHRSWQKFIRTPKILPSVSLNTWVATRATGEWNLPHAILLSGYYADGIWVFNIRARQPAAMPTGAISKQGLYQITYLPAGKFGKWNLVEISRDFNIQATVQHKQLLTGETGDIVVGFHNKFPFYWRGMVKLTLGHQNLASKVVALNPNSSTTVSFPETISSTNELHRHLSLFENGKIIYTSEVSLTIPTANRTTPLKIPVYISYLFLSGIVIIIANTARILLVNKNSINAQ